MEFAKNLGKTERESHLRFFLIFFPVFKLKLIYVTIKYSWNPILNKNISLNLLSMVVFGKIVIATCLF